MKRRSFVHWAAVAAACLSLLAGCALQEPKPAAPLKIGLALGGGAARGFAHVGVIKALEAQGIFPDIIVGTSAGAVVGSLYASGYTGFELQNVALEMTEKQVIGWAWPNRGWIDGEVLQNFINKAVGYRPLQELPRKIAVVATDLKSGDPMVFGTGNTGMAVRASAAVPGVFQPVSISGREYVDGGLVSPIPVRFARQLGANFVIAVDISSRPQDGATDSTLDVLMQTFSIMGKVIGKYETAEADVVIRPMTSGLPATDLSGRHRAILEGEKAAAQVMAELKDKLERARATANGGR
jgi:NTE family protein